MNEIKKAFTGIGMDKDMEEDVRTIVKNEFEKYIQIAMISLLIILTIFFIGYIAGGGLK